MPFFDSPYRFGNLYMNFNIVFPTNLDEKQKESLKKLFPGADCEVKTEGITEKYPLKDYTEEDDNTYATGGKKKRKNSMGQTGGDDDDDEGEGRQGARGVQCANQ